jgi:outer membrane cobalamin receptor
MNSCHLRTAGRGLPRRPVVVLLSTILSLSGASALAQTAAAPATPAVSSSIAASYSTAAAPAAPAASAVSAAIELPGIVVSATGDPTPAADVGSSVTVITADQIAAQQTPAYTIPITETKLMGSVGTGFKAPSLSDLFQNFPGCNFVANPNLKPEESTGFDVGFEQPFLNNRVRVGRPISITTSQM